MTENLDENKTTDDTSESSESEEYLPLRRSTRRRRPPSRYQSSGPVFSQNNRNGSGSRRRPRKVRTVRRRNITNKSSILFTFQLPGCSRSTRWEQVEQSEESMELASGPVTPRQQNPGSTDYSLVSEGFSSPPSPLRDWEVSSYQTSSLRSLSPEVEVDRRNISPIPGTPDSAPAPFLIRLFPTSNQMPVYSNSLSQPASLESHDHETTSRPVMRYISKSLDPETFTKHPNHNKRRQKTNLLQFWCGSCPKEFTTEKMILEHQNLHYPKRFLTITEDTERKLASRFISALRIVTMEVPEHPSYTPRVEYHGNEFSPSFENLRYNSSDESSFTIDSNSLTLSPTSRYMS